MTTRPSSPASAATPAATPAGAPDAREAPVVPDGMLRQATPAGAPMFEGMYHGGRRHGPFRCYDAHGRLLQEAEYVDDLPHGVTTLYADGRVLCSQTYRRGVLEGEMLCYAPSGTVSARLPYRDGRLHGQARFFHDDQLLRRATYRAGRLDGPCEDFDAFGHPVQTANYRSGVLHGPLIRYWPNGRKMEEHLYQAGRGVVATRHFDPQGRETVDSASRAGKWARGLENWVRG